MTENEWKCLKDGDTIVHKSNSADKMSVVEFDYYGTGKEICFVTEQSIYPQSEFSCSEWSKEEKAQGLMPC